jgi:SAM-dependent methyltransferase
MSTSNSSLLPPIGSPFDDGELYDTWLENYDGGLDFYKRLAAEARGPLLEVACGTGRVLLRLMQAGYDIDGVDLFESMLKQLRAKATARGLSPHVQQGDMAGFKMPRKYALVMIPFNAFIHNETQERQIDCLNCCREHLLPGGLLAFDTFFPGPKLICQPQGERVLEGEYTHPVNGTTVRFYDTRTFDRVRQIQHSFNEVEETTADGSINVLHRSEFDARWVYKDEMALLLRVAGFSRWEIDGNYDGKPLTEETDQMIVRAWR